MRQRNNKKNGNGRPRRRFNGRSGRTGRSNATRILANGVAASVPKAFGDSPGYGMQCWDAKHYSHLPLPRSVGPYTVIRATKRVQVSSIANIIGTFQRRYGDSPQKGFWSTNVLVSSVAANNPINATLPANASFYTLPLEGLGEAATLVPSALSVQIMCPTALNDASGILYAGVMNTQAAIGGRGDTWNEYMEKFVQFQSPRLLAASKLALRGVQINSYPLNMTEVSKFTPLFRAEEADAVYDGDQEEPTGWAPIVIYNPQQANIELLITVEYRLRFDLDHPASASHSHHPISSDYTWDKMTKSAVALGNGVLDIADVVANTGMAVGRAMAVGKKLAAIAGPAAPLALTL